jgi:malic enzyme
VKDAFPGRSFEFGPDYIIPTPFDPRLITALPIPIAQAAIDSGVSK